MDFSYKWKLSDLAHVSKSNCVVFSCFACGGGSTMGYKMSGYEVIGCNEIDSEMIDNYKRNHVPKYAFLESIETFKLRQDLPEELFNLDILDGSPPCSSFSSAGSREKKWGKLKKFREGQSEQILDDLFFHFIDLAKKLKPKVVVAKNVKGLIEGRAKGYVKLIVKRLNEAGYNVQLFLLNGATMGLPQERERVFFIAHRKDLAFKKIKLNFKEEYITAHQATGLVGHLSNSANMRRIKLGRRPRWYSHERASPTVMGTGGVSICERNAWRELNASELRPLSSFPEDYEFKNDEQAKYVMGMSVPPLMMHKISREIYRQWLEPLKHSDK